MVIAAAAVPFWLANALGSTETVMVAGVTPLDGEMVIPLVLVDNEKGV